MKKKKIVSSVIATRYKLIGELLRVELKDELLQQDLIHLLRVEIETNTDFLEDTLNLHKLWNK